ncbi:DEAD/DEAH box helicase, partial [Acidobacteria bacterium ACD]|nr:DEAD/DEAH box helicase [Acidobacteria bacterium ACD]
MTFAVGSLVAARGREWVVLPESEDDFLVLRPLGGTEEETAGIFPALEAVRAASFAPPDPSSHGDFRSCRLLRDAVRLGFRSSAGPFRSFGAIAVEPRPYQLVPLLMALKLDPVRLLIADDVGIGKTVEAGLVASELLARGEADRLAVLCPPALAEQWQRELRQKFHVEAELVLPSTVTRLERGCGPGVSLFDRHPFVIVSMDFIKSEARRLDFLRACPDLVIVDEAHTCAAPADGRGGSHQRHALVRGLAEKKDRHVILVTATPHSGKEEAFRSLLGLMHREFLDLPRDLSGDENRPHRARLAAHLVQRRRGDIRRFLNAETDFPERKDRELSYDLSPEYRALFERVLTYTRETVQGAEKGTRRERIRWWSAIALLRSLASSPAAAAATLRKRADTVDADDDQVDELGARAALDLTEDEGVEGLDVAPGAEPGEEGSAGDASRRRLLEFARVADGLKGAKDTKLHAAAKLLDQLLAEGFNPIVFCRFIPTAEYVAEELRKLLRKGVEVAAVTGDLPPEEREERVEALGKAPRRVLVATDCLSEGINLQHSFDAVFHYDLSWNPTRHEQREGRVDRYLQKSREVRAVTFFGRDNRIDGIVLDVLLRKHKKIRSDLGISVSVPAEAEDVMKAVFEGLFLRGRPSDGAQLVFDAFEADHRPSRERLHGEWQAAADREKRSRSLFAQETIKTREVEAEMKAVQAAVGSGADAARFVREARAAHRAVIRESDPLEAEYSEAPL